MTSPAAVRIEERGDARVVRIARPPANAIDLGLVRALGEVLDALESRSDAKPVVLIGEGRFFSGGIDIKAVPAYTAAQKREMVGAITRTVGRLYVLPRPVVAAVNGHAIGGGLVLALACDFRLAARGPWQLGLTEVTAGIPFPAGPMAVVRAELAPPAARVLTLSGKILAPEEALALGVVDGLVDPDCLLDRALEKAVALAGAAAYGRVKTQLREETGAAIARIVEEGSDPMLRAWI